jgi:hypothetical protein
MKRGFSAGVLFSALIFAACSSGSGDSGGGSATNCASASQVLCKKIDSCEHVVIGVLYGDVSTCATRLAIACGAEAHAPDSGMSESQFATCINATAAMSCDDLLGGASSPAACNLPGSRADGEPCGFDSQCKSTQCSITSGLCGTCSPRAAAGGACTGSSDCQDGLVCANQVCATPIQAGGACTSSSACAGQLFCKNGVCAKPLAAGEACNPTASECDLAAGLICDSVSSTCVAFSLAKTGEACGEVNGKPVGCAANGKCKASTGQTSGTCTAALADGAACTSSDNCSLPAECTNGICTLPSSNGCG